MNQIEQNEKIVKSFSRLKYCSDKHDHQRDQLLGNFLILPVLAEVFMVHNFYGTVTFKISLNG